MLAQNGKSMHSLMHKWRLKAVFMQHFFPTFSHQIKVAFYFLSNWCLIGLHFWKISPASLLSSPGIMFQQETHQIKGERCFCFWPLMSLLNEIIMNAFSSLPLIKYVLLYELSTLFEPLTTHLFCHIDLLSFCMCCVCIYVCIYTQAEYL